MREVLSVVEFLNSHRIIVLLLLACLAAWTAESKSLRAVWDGRFYRLRNALLMSLLGITVAVGCSKQAEDAYAQSGCAVILRLDPLTAHRVARVLHPAAQSAAALSGVPYLPFQGNQTLLAPPVDSAGNMYGVGLQRQSDCSLTEYIVANFNPMTDTFSVNNTIPGYQNTLHSLAQLKTTAGQFSGGCKDANLGISSTTGVLLGPTKDGTQYIAAAVSPENQALLTGTINLTAGTVAKSTVSSILYPASVASADLNGDGYNDLIVAGVSNNSTLAGAVYVLLSNGDGTFQTPVAYATNGVNTTAVTIDDVNGDGKLDIVATGSVSGQTTGGVQTLLGNGNGTFQAAVTSPAIGASYLATGDFNKDGKKDLVLSNGSILLGNGDGTFAAPAFTLPLQLGQNTTVGSVAVADLNKDGNLDVAIDIPGGPYVSIFPGKGDGTFTAGKSYGTLTDSADLAVTDLDGDGNPDLVLGLAQSGQYGPSVQTHTGVVTILMGNGDGSFQGAPALPNGPAYDNFNSGSPAPSFAVGDFNGDGKLDLLGTSVSVTGGVASTKGLVVFTGDGKGNFTPGSPVGSSTPAIIAAADMDGDGKLDAVIAEGANSIGVFNIGVALGNGAGSFQTTVDYALPANTNIENLAVADFNGDNKPDVLVATNAGALGGPYMLYLLLNNGDGTLAAPVAIDTLSSSPVDLAVGDLNGDGKIDFVVTTAAVSSPSTAGSLLVYINKGSSGFNTSVSYSPGFRPSAVAIADLNKDGKADVVVGSVDQNYTQGTIATYLGNGDGTLKTPLTLTTSETAFSSLAVADINGDTHPDVVFGASLTQIAFGNGDGTLQAPYAVAVGTSPQSVTAIDVTGDQRPDLLFASNNSIEVMTNLYGSVTLPANTTTTLSISPNPAATGQSITFTGQVAPTTGTGTPTGTVAFMNGATQLGSGTLNGNGQATFSTNSLAAGSYSVTAVYIGDTNFAASTSTATSLTVSANAVGDFAVSANPASLSVTAGASGTSTITVTPQNGFSQAVSFSCSGLPSAASCSFSPATVTPSGSSASTTMTISTTGATASNKTRWPLAGSGAALAVACLVLFPRRRYANLLCLTVLLGIVGFALGCGGGGGSKSSGNPGTPAGTSTVTVSATSGTGTSALSHTTTVSLTVH